MNRSAKVCLHFASYLHIASIANKVKGRWVEAGEITMAAKKRSVCPLACTLDVIGDKWTLLVIRDLACGKRFFNEFCQSPERIATNILASRLEKLVGSGLVSKRSCPEAPNRDEYNLTAKGKSLGPVLAAVAEWGLAHIPGTKALLVPSFA
jgi:DNA-binding HxlR family transcriptional regulator